jgi:PAS domain-containing protein
MGSTTMVRLAGAPASRGGAAAPAASSIRHHSGRRVDPAFLPARHALASASLPAMALPDLDPVLEALADSGRHFRILIEQAADGILVVDGQGLVSLASSRSCEMTGYSPDEIVGLDLLDTYLPVETRQASCPRSASGARPCASAAPS